LTAAEIKHAQNQRKQLTRKLQQLEKRAQQKDKRAALYEQLRVTSVQNKALLQSSATLGQKETTRQRLRRAKQKESAGLTLTQEEQDLLYSPRKRERNEDEPQKDQPVANDDRQTNSTGGSPAKRPTLNEDTSSSLKRRKGGGETKQQDTQDKHVAESYSPRQDASSPQGKASTPAISAAAQMMAFFHHLKQNNASNDATQTKLSLEEEINENPNSKRKAYVPSNPVVISTTPSYAPTKGSTLQLQSNKERPVLHRPADVITIRNELPFVAMELEVMDAIQQHDIVILWAETGSGKVRCICRPHPFLVLSHCTLY